MTDATVTAGRDMTDGKPQITRHFLGWDQPVIARVVALLTAAWRSGALDLSDQMLVVPTRNAARRLREALAEAASARGSAVLPPLTVTPEHFLTPEPRRQRIASRAEMLAFWIQTLRLADARQCGSLFPRRNRDAGTSDFDWLVGSAARLMRVRVELSENGLDLRDAAAALQDGPEAERWQELAALEQQYLAGLAEAGLSDETAAKIATACNPQCPEGIVRIRVLAVPDPIPLAVSALERLSRVLPVEVFVHAPGELADAFDHWGRPLPAVWESADLEIPDAERNVMLAETPADQACEIGRIVDALSLAPDDVTVGVPDGGVVPHIRHEFASRDVETFDPAGEPLMRHPAAGLVGALAGMLHNRDYRSLAVLMRHPDMLVCLKSEHKDWSAPAFLEQLDAFQSVHLPHSLAQIQRLLQRPGAATAWPDLSRALDSVRDILGLFEEHGLAEGFSAALRRIYRDRELDPRRPPDTSFADVAKCVCRLLVELNTPEMQHIGLTDKQRVTLLMRLLESQTIYGDRKRASVDLLGWLELAWDDSPYLVISGMNDGCVPKAIVGDAFLPDSARTLLGLPDNRHRFARDAYMLAAMIEARRTLGGTVLLVGRKSAQHDALRPSRLLFLCPRDELAGRALRLFDEVVQPRAVVARSLGWRLTPPSPDTPERMRVTQFRDYLACPFRFYLKHVLDMSEQDDGKLELDSLDFGILCHAALEVLGRPESAGQTDPAVLSRRLEEVLEAEVRGRFGNDLSAPVLIQVESARMRLLAAARLQAELNAEGWRIVATEYSIGKDAPAEIGGMRVTGKIDRIDRHPDGRLRILDYKTSDSGQAPDKVLWAAHREDTPGYAAVTVQGRQRRWQDLQLPLYKILLRNDPRFADAPVECGYFNLPKATRETALALWTGATPELIESARRCAEGVAADVRNRRFWPPAEKLRYDDFERLLFDAPSRYVDGAAMGGLDRA